MRILHLISSLNKGGAERLALDTVRALNSIPGVEAQLAVMSPLNEYAAEYPDIVPHILNAKVTPSVSGKWEVHLDDWDGLLREFKPQVIHSHLFEAEMLCRYKMMPDVLYVTHCHDNMHQFKRLRMSEVLHKKRLTEAYERRFMIRRYRDGNNHFLAISPDTRDYFVTELPPDLAKKVLLFPNAIDVARFSKKRASFPEKGKIRLVNAGSFVPKKNQAFLVEVMQELKQRGTDAELTLAGDGPLRDSVKQKAEQAGLSGQILFPGKVPEMERHMSNSHVYVHSASYEPFGLVLLEAMAAGLPVVCLDGRGNRELIKHGKNGFMVHPPDASEFADRILQCVSDAETWNRLSLGAQEFALQYDIASYAQRLLAFYTHSQTSPRV